jgi:hypothetical protein
VQRALTAAKRGNANECHINTVTKPQHFTII